jgi:hypothetical protein
MIARADQSAPDVSVEIAGTIECLGRGTWDTLFCDHPESYDNVALTQRVGMDGITFQTLIVSDREGPLLVLPTFLTTFDSVSMADGRARTFLRAAARVAPGLLRPRILGVGLVEGEWAAIGVRPGCEASALDHAWQQAMRELRDMARRAGASTTVLLDVCPSDLARIPARALRGYSPVRTSACGRVPVAGASVESYLAGLSRSTRQGLRRKLRASSAIRVERPNGIAPLLGPVVDLYRATVERAPVVLGVHRPDYFARVEREVPGAHYVLYFLAQKLVGFNLLVERAGTLLDKYFCMDPLVGREHNLYFVSWIENIRHAASRGLGVYHAGPGSEETKRHLGCRFIQSRTLFRHTSPVAHRVLSLLARSFARDSSAPTADGVWA